MSTAALVRQLHTYECIYCKWWATSPERSFDGTPLRCNCGSWLRWRNVRAITTREDRALADKGLVFFWPFAELEPKIVPTKTCAYRPCRKPTPVQELVSGQYCSHVCEEGDQRELAELKERVEILYQTRPWLRPIPKVMEE